MEKLKASYITDGDAKWSSCFGQAVWRLPYDPGFSSQENESMCLNKNLYMNVHSGLFVIAQSGTIPNAHQLMIR